MADDVMVLRLTSSVKGALSFKAVLSRQENAAAGVGHKKCGRRKAHAATLEGSLESGIPGKRGISYKVSMTVASSDGKAVYSDGAITLTGASEATLIISAATSYSAEGTIFPGERYVSFCDSLLDAAPCYIKRPLKYMERNRKASWATPTAVKSSHPSIAST